MYFFLKVLEKKILRLCLWVIMMNEEEFNISSVMCFCFLSSGVCVNANKTETFTRKKYCEFSFQECWDENSWCNTFGYLSIDNKRELCLAGDGGRFWGNPQKLQEVVVSHFMTAGHNEIGKTATTTKLWQFLREFACIVISLSQLHTATERAMETFENWNRGENASASKPTKRNGTRMQKAKQIPQ